MALRSTSKQELTIAFVLDEDALRQLISKIQSTIGQQTVTSFNVGFSDKTTITTSSISDVLSLPNSGLKTIEQIAFTITRGPSSAKTYKFKFLRRARKAIQALRGADSDTNKDRVGSAASNPNDGSADEARSRSQSNFGTLRVFLPSTTRLQGTNARSSTLRLQSMRVC
jgi:hypothetical protein